MAGCRNQEKEHHMLVATAAHGGSTLHQTHMRERRRTQQRGCQGPTALFVVRAPVSGRWFGFSLSRVFLSSSPERKSKSLFLQRFMLDVILTCSRCELSLWSTELRNIPWSYLEPLGYCGWCPSDHEPSPARNAGGAVLGWADVRAARRRASSSGVRN